MSSDEQQDVLDVLAACDRMGIVSFETRAELIGEPDLALRVLGRAANTPGIHNPAAFAIARFRKGRDRRATEARARRREGIAGELAEVTPAPPRLRDLEQAWSLGPSAARDALLRAMAAAVGRHGGFAACWAYMVGETDEPPPYSHA